MSYQQNFIQINEFSKGFNNPHYSEKYKRWVSGGYAQEIGSYKFQSPPEEIKAAVIQGYFKINDNYPPENEQVALIARDINEYSVLAIATGEFDDKGERPLVAYRYFWLKKPDQSVDGIATLLNWWKSQGEPHFEFPGSQNSENLNYSAPAAQIEDLEDCLAELEKDIDLLHFLSEITYYPYVFANHSNQNFSRSLLHYITLYLHQKYNHAPLAWTWNVRWLEKSTSSTLTLIHCADEQAYQYISNNLNKHKIPLQYSLSDLVANPSVQLTPLTHKNAKQLERRVSEQNSAPRQIFKYVEINRALLAGIFIAGVFIGYSSTHFIASGDIPKKFHYLA